VNSEPTVPHKIKDMSWKSSSGAELCVTVSAYRNQMLCYIFFHNILPRVLWTYWTWARNISVFNYFSINILLSSLRWCIWLYSLKRDKNSMLEEITTTQCIITQKSTVLS